MPTTAQAREYERKYHEGLYKNYGLSEPGSWLSDPAPYALKSKELVPKHDNVHVLDLGGGVGRHSIPLAEYFGATSEIVCVDLLDTAIEQLKANAKKSGVEGNITGIVADVETVGLGGKPYDLVLSVSCIEHIPAKARLEAFIRQLQKSTAKNGVHCFMMMTDIEWIDLANSKQLIPLIEQNLSFEETAAMLKHLYNEWQIHDLSTKTWEIPQPINGRDVILKSTCVQFTAQKSEV